MNKNCFFFSLRKQPTSHNANTGSPVKGHLRKKCWNSILMTCHYPDLDCASDCLELISHAVRPDLGRDHRHQCGISAFVSRMSFCRETSGGVAKYRLFSLATSFQTLSINNNIFLWLFKLNWEVLVIKILTCTVPFYKGSLMPSSGWME